jgi:hypothetical protein
VAAPPPPRPAAAATAREAVVGFGAPLGSVFGAGGAERASSARAHVRRLRGRGVPRGGKDRPMQAPSPRRWAWKSAAAAAGPQAAGPKGTARRRRRRRDVIFLLLHPRHAPARQATPMRRNVLGRMHSTAGPAVAALHLPSSRFWTYLPLKQLLY